jgi:hypothetical protein
MVYMNQILKYLLLVFYLLGMEQLPPLLQTCCSGGVPMYSNVDGTQLTPSFRMQVGYYHAFQSIKNTIQIHVNYET